MVITSANPTLNSQPRLLASGASPSSVQDGFQSSLASTSPLKFKDFLAATRAPGPLPATLGDVTGPYYRANAPVRSSLFPPGEAGEPVNYSFSVVDPQGNPVQARVDVWTADSAGVYDMDSSSFRGRAQGDVRDGSSAEFAAVKPGNYDLGTDPQGNKIYRPAHVHVKIRQAGKPELTTQLYFPNDPWNNLDPILDPEEREGRGFDPSLLMTETQPGQFSYRFVVQ